MRLEVESYCPCCGCRLSGAVGQNTNLPPRPGDFTVCAYCYEILRFQEDLSLRRLLPYDEIDNETRETLNKVVLGLMQASQMGVDPS
jgi:hypothetical protein